MKNSTMEMMKTATEINVNEMWKKVSVNQPMMV